mmetsp:Transcript_8781/g.19204  ORF Transcript_8781/g.19204 Transcript_8781/m.19204 type:complete len:292 (+) Transcript_8781:569-1444(+)
MHMPLANRVATQTPGCRFVPSNRSPTLVRPSKVIQSPTKYPWSIVVVTNASVPDAMMLLTPIFPQHPAVQVPVSPSSPVMPCAVRLATVAAVASTFIKSMLKQPFSIRTAPAATPPSAQSVLSTVLQTPPGHMAANSEVSLSASPEVRATTVSLVSAATARWLPVHANALTSPEEDPMEIVVVLVQAVAVEVSHNLTRPAQQPAATMFVEADPVTTLPMPDIGASIDCVVRYTIALHGPCILTFANVKSGVDDSPVVSTGMLKEFSSTTVTDQNPSTPRNNPSTTAPTISA